MLGRCSNMTLVGAETNSLAQRAEAPPQASLPVSSSGLVLAEP